MVYIISRISYPSHKIQEVLQKQIKETENLKVDESLGETGLTALKTTEKGMLVISVLEVKEGKLEEALNWTNTALYPFLEIEGYEYTIDTFYSMEEALAVAGVKMPE
jgi:hypothetical protein